MKVIYCSKDNFISKREELRKNFYKCRFDTKRADFFARNGVRMLSLIVK